jgi:nicotinamide-nucleotide amidase
LGGPFGSLGPSHRPPRAEPAASGIITGMDDHGDPRMRHVLTADLLAVGTELTTGDTRDTNGGDLAGDLAAAGVAVRRIAAVPDDLDLVTGSIAAALSTVDLLVTTGGLGPTPDDLTREALAAALREEPAVDPTLEAHLRALFRRRGMRLPAINLKQAWLIPSATSIPNPNGTAPGWWVEGPDGRVAVLLPGPPREMRPMWREWVLPRLRERGLGDGRVVRTLRTYGIGESHVAERLGEPMLRTDNPIVATYARAEWLDVRITAIDDRDADGRIVRSARALLDETTARVRQLLEGFVLAEDDTSWAELVERAAARTGVRFATAEWGSRGALAGLLADVPSLARSVVAGPAVALDPATAPVESLATAARAEAEVDVGLALVALSSDRDTHLRAAIAGPAPLSHVPSGRGDVPNGHASDPVRVLELRLFQHGPHGRLRAGVAAAAFLAQVLDEAATASAPAAAAPGGEAEEARDGR